MTTKKRVKRSKKLYSGYEMVVRVGDKIVEKGHPYKTRKSAMEDAKNIANELRKKGKKNVRASTRRIQSEIKPIF